MIIVYFVLAHILFYILLVNIVRYKKSKVWVNFIGDSFEYIGDYGIYTMIYSRNKNHMYAFLKMKCSLYYINTMGEESRWKDSITHKPHYVEFISWLGYIRVNRFLKKINKRIQYENEKEITNKGMEMKKSFIRKEKINNILV